MNYRNLQSEDVYVSRELEGEKKMLLRMIQIAVLDATREASNPKRLRRKREAREWLLRDILPASDAEGFTFARICEHLDLNKKVLRKRIVRYLRHREVWN